MRRLTAQGLQFGERLVLRLVTRTVRLRNEPVEAAAGVDDHPLVDTGVAAIEVLGIVADANGITFRWSAALAEQSTAGLTRARPGLGRTAPAARAPAAAAGTGRSAGSEIAASRTLVGSLM